MFVGIHNAPRDYAWGSDGAITELLGAPPTGKPEAELWLGAHAGSPALIEKPSQIGGASTLEEWIAAAPAQALGGHPRLPFLLKVLAAKSPLSLQAHPTEAQAQEGFERENSLGVPLESPQRNYTDPYPKPEIIFALSEKFEALCGFRPIDETQTLLGSLGLLELRSRVAEKGLRSVVESLITRGDGVDQLVGRVTELGSTASATAESTPDASVQVATARETVRTLATHYPGDPGIVVALLLNRVTLRRGEALFLPAGNIHAYLNGLGIELMTASDNVLRGGLSPKHVDVDELLRVLDFTPTPVPYLHPRVEGGAEEYRPDGAEFVLTRVTGGARHTLTGPAIVFCTVGSTSIAGGEGSVQLSRGDAVYITPDEAELSFSGEGEAFLATTS